MRHQVSEMVLRRPVAFGIVLIIIWWAVLLLFASGLPPFSPSWFPDLRSTLVNLGALLVPLAVVVAFGWWRQAGLALPRPNRSWWSLLPLLAFALSFAVGGLSGSPAQFMSSAGLFLALGLNEELLYRGVIQYATNTLGALRSVIWVAVLFGIQHAGTGIFFGHSLYDVSTMMISSTASGAAYAAVRLRIGTIWPLAFCMGWRTSATPAVPETPPGGGTCRRLSSTFSMRHGCSGKPERELLRTPLPRNPVNSAGRRTGARRSGPMVAALYNTATFLPPSLTHLFSTTENPFLHPPRGGVQRCASARQEGDRKRPLHQTGSDLRDCTSAI